MAKKLMIRKITPEESFILMGLTREDAQKCKNVGISDSKIYQIAGNGLITNVVSHIAQHLYKAQYDENYKTDDEIASEKYGRL